VAVQDVERIRLDAGLSVRAVARAAAVDPGYVSDVLNGRRIPTVAVITALAGSLGADVSVRVYPNTGPRIHDRSQAPIVEELLRIAHESWRRTAEVAVRTPARGVVDVVLDQPEVAVCTEVQTRIDRLEQFHRWSQAKADSLPSSDLWLARIGEATISRLLILRSTRSTRELVRAFEETLRTAFPASAHDAFQSLTEPGVVWPGAALLWADVRGDVVRILDHPPRRIRLGRD
jgi:transcriptional regulator with XRE-family HTH domain